jgi:hypothetical protein
VNPGDNSGRCDRDRIGPGSGRPGQQSSEAPSRWRRGAATHHWVPLVDRRDLRVVLNRFLLYPDGLLFSVDLAAKPAFRPASGRPALLDDIMTVRTRFPDGTEVDACLIVPGSRPGCAIGTSYIASAGGEPGAPCLRVLAAEAADDTASYAMWMWPQPPGLFQVELEWLPGDLRVDTLVDLPWVASMWGPKVLT